MERLDSRNVVELARKRPAPRLPARLLEPALRPLAEAALAIADGRLARIWLDGPGDLCAACPMRPECPDRRRCLHLVASAGLTTRTDGPWRRYPIGAREVGRVPLTGAPFEAAGDLAELGLADAMWLSNHHIRAFAALPLTLGGRCIGVLALFSGRELDDAARRALAGLAALGAAALGSMRAWRDLAHEHNRVVARATTRGAGHPTGPVLRLFADTEREVVARVLAHTGGRVSGPRGAAAILGLKPTTLFSRMKKLGIERKPRP